MNKNVKIILILGLFLVISKLKCDINHQGSFPQGGGWSDVSKKVKIREIDCFYFESTKRKVFEKRQNVCKLITFLLKYFSGNQEDRFKTNIRTLAQKLTKKKKFAAEIGRGPTFDWKSSVSLGRRPKNKS